MRAIRRKEGTSKARQKLLLCGKSAEKWPKKAWLWPCISREPLDRLHSFKWLTSGFSNGFPTKAWWERSDEGKIPQKLAKCCHFVENRWKSNQKGLTLAVHISGATGLTALVQVTNLWLFLGQLPGSQKESWVHRQPPAILGQKLLLFWEVGKLG